MSSDSELPQRVKAFYERVSTERLRWLYRVIFRQLVA